MRACGRFRFTLALWTNLGVTDSFSFLCAWVNEREWMSHSVVALKLFQLEPNHKKWPKGCQKIKYSIYTNSYNFPFPGLSFSYNKETEDLPDNCGSLTLSRSRSFALSPQQLRKKQILLWQNSNKNLLGLRNEQFLT